MTDFHPSSPDPYMRMEWAMQNCWWAVIPFAVALVVLVELAQDRLGQTGETLVPIGLFVFGLGALGYDRRAEQRRAEAEADRGSQ